MCGATQEPRSREDHQLTNSHHWVTKTNQLLLPEPWRILVLNSCRSEEGHSLCSVSTSRRWNSFTFLQPDFYFICETWVEWSKRTEAELVLLWSVRSRCVIGLGFGSDLSASESVLLLLSSAFIMWLSEDHFCCSSHSAVDLSHVGWLRLSSGFITASSSPPPPPPPSH